MTREGRRLIWGISAVCLAAGIYVTWDYFTDFIVFRPIGKDVSGKFEVYAEAETFIFTSNHSSYFISSPPHGLTAYAGLVNPPAYRLMGRLFFSRGHFEGTRMKMMYENAQPVREEKGYLLVWIKDAGRAEIVRIREAD